MPKLVVVRSMKPPTFLAFYSLDAETGGGTQAVEYIYLLGTVYRPF